MIVNTFIQSVKFKIVLNILCRAKILNNCNSKTHYAKFALKWKILAIVDYKKTTEIIGYNKEITG